MVDSSVNFVHSLVTDSEQKISCFYKNVTSKMQIIRINDNHDLQLERVIFPNERLIFEARQNSILEIQYRNNFRLLLPCYQLKINQEEATSSSNIQ